MFGRPDFVQALAPARVSPLLLALCLTAAGAYGQTDNNPVVSRPTSVSSVSSGLSAAQASTDMMQKMTQAVRTPGSPPSPLLGLPVEGFSIAAPVLLTFSWRDGDGVPRATSFRFCIAEIGTRCGDTGSYVAPSPYAPNPITGTTVEVPFDPAWLGPPTALQGRRLMWTVAACAPNPTLPVIRGTAPESCTYAPYRTLDYPLPAPLLMSPESGARLSDRYPQLKWEYVKGAFGTLQLSGVEHWLVCITRPGMACPQDTVAHTDMFVARVPVQRTVSGGPIRVDQTKEQRYSVTAGNPLSLTGTGPFIWTVAACNTAYGCRYQPNVRQIELAPTR
jgi:hypothetical protein